MGQNEYHQSPNFHQKYNLISKTQCILNQSSSYYVCNKASVYQIINIISSDRFTITFLHKLKNLFNKSVYRVQISDLYTKASSEQLNMLLIYPKIGVNLQQIVMNRAQIQVGFKEQDVSYMLQCICNGLKQLERFGWANFVLTPLLIIFCFDSSFKIFNFILENCWLNSLLFNSLLANHQRNQSYLASFHQKWKYYLCKIWDPPHKPTINLLSLGISCLYMHDYTFRIQSLFDPLTQQFVYAKLLARINKIKDEKLKWKIWLLTSQYYQERREIYRQSHIDFLQTCNSLQRDANFAIDSQFIRGQKIQRSSCSIQKYNYISSSKNHDNPQISEVKQNKTMLSTKICSKNKPRINFTFSDKPQSIPNSTLAKKHQPIPEIILRNIQLSYAKKLISNIEITDQTQSSPRKNIQQLHVPKREMEIQAVVEMETKQQTTRKDIGLQQIQQQDIVKISNYEQQNSQDSIIQVNIQESDEQEENQFFTDIRVKHYSIDRHIQPLSNHHLCENIAQEIIRQENSMDFSGDIEIASEEDMEDDGMKFIEQQERNQLLLTSNPYY